MDTFVFSGLGTQWSIDVDGVAFRLDDKRKILDYVIEFERRFSRFLPESEVNRFRATHSGTHEISSEFAEMLERASEMRSLSDGLFDPAVGRLLELAGYDAQYRFSQSEGTERFRLPRWFIKDNNLTIHGSVGFDLGGIGKGYCIDGVSAILKDLGYDYHIVEAGGDMYATTKANGSPFRIAIEWPGDPKRFVGTVSLACGGLAVSDSFRRRWGQWHHILNPIDHKAVSEVLGCTAVASSAKDADTMTSLLFLSGRDRFGEIASRFSASYMVFYADTTMRASSNWSGELY